MKPEIIVYRKIPPDLLKLLHQHFEVHNHELKQPMDSSFYHDLSRANALIGSILKIDSKLLDKAPNLKMVVNISVGYDNLDIEELTKRGIMATNTPDVLTETVADTVFGLLLATARRIPEMDHFVKSGQWNENLKEQWFGMDVHHKTLGIIGMGRIGLAVAERAHYGFKMNILYHNRSKNIQAEQDLQAKYVSLQKLLQESDYVCLLAPLLPETVHMIGKKEFQLMKESAIFINGSRGKLVDEKALIEALQTNEILAAGLDVYEAEPLAKDSPLLHIKNAVTLPHIGSATLETRYQMAKLAVENLIKGLNQENPPSLINKTVLKK